MKKLCAVIVVAAIIAIAGYAMAGIGVKVGGDLKGAAKSVAGSAAATGVNSELNNYECLLKTGTKDVDKCIRHTKKGDKNADLNAIAGVLSGGRKTAEKQGGVDFEINIHAKDSSTCQNVAGKLKTMLVDSWDMNYKTDKSLGDKVTFSVDIK